MNMEPGAGNAQPQQPCAVCRHQRKRCGPNCPMAPYFPGSRFAEFQNAYKLFGMRRIQTMLNSVAPEEREKTADSILKEATARMEDPVHGSLGVVLQLQAQIRSYEIQLEAVNKDLAANVREIERQLQNLGGLANVQPLLQAPDNEEDLNVVERIFDFLPPSNEGLDQPTMDPEAGTSGNEDVEVPSSSSDPKGKGSSSDKGKEPMDQ